MTPRHRQRRTVSQRPVRSSQQLPQPLVGAGALELAEQRGERCAADRLALLQATEKGTERLRYVARTVEGEPRLEQIGAGVHPLSVYPQPEGIRLRARAEPERRGATLRVHHGAEF